MSAVDVADAVVRQSGPTKGALADSSAAGAAASSTASSVSDEKNTIADGPIVCPGHTRPVPDVHFSPVIDDRFFLASACLDNKSMLRDGSSGDWIGTFEGHQGAVWSCRLNHLGDRAVTASADYTVKLWNAVSGDCVHTWEHKARMQCANFSKDGNTIYSGGYDKMVRVFDLTSAEYSEKQVLQGLDGAPINVLVTADPNIIVAGGSKTKHVLIWDLRSGEIVHRCPIQGDLKALSIADDGRMFVTGAGRHVQLWDATKFQPLANVSTARNLECAVYDHSRQAFLTGEYEDSWIRVYSRETSKETECYKGHHGWIRCLALSPNGTSFASGSEDATIRIWDWTRESAAADQP